VQSRKRHSKLHASSAQQGEQRAHPESMRAAVIALMLDLRVSEMVEEKLPVIPT
jgi:hypothetical protein